MDQDLSKQKKDDSEDNTHAAGINIQLKGSQYVCRCTARMIEQDDTVSQ